MSEHDTARTELDHIRGGFADREGIWTKAYQESCPECYVIDRLEAEIERLDEWINAHAYDSKGFKI